MVVEVRGLIRDSVTVEVWYYKAKKSMRVFQSVWCYKEALCSVEGGELFFAHGIR